jgi:hypothetical protein
VLWTDPVMKFIDVSTSPRRIVGVAADEVVGPARVPLGVLDREDFVDRKRHRALTRRP